MTEHCPEVMFLLILYGRQRTLVLLLSELRLRAIEVYGMRIEKVIWRLLGMPVDHLRLVLQ